MTMQVQYDSRAHAAWLVLDGTEGRTAVDTVEVVPDLVLVEVDADGEPVAIELLTAPAELAAGDLDPVFARFPAIRDEVLSGLVGVGYQAA